MTSFNYRSDYRESILAIDPMAPRTIYVSNNGLVKTTNGGDTWATVHLPVSAGLLAIDPATSPPTTSARVFIDYRSGVLGIPSRPNSGVVDVNTGIGIVNCGSDTAHINYYLSNSDGFPITDGQSILPAGNHFAKFINQLNEIAPEFQLPSGFQFASLSIASDQPLSVLALRMTINQRGEPIFTTTPVADVNQPVSYLPLHFPQIVDGGGYTTTLILLNNSSETQSGLLKILDNNGLPLTIRMADGKTGSSFDYFMDIGRFVRFQTDGSSENAKFGWVQMTVGYGNTSHAPTGSGVFSYNPGNVLITESGIPGARATTHARLYVDLTKNHNTGVAVANLSNSAATLSIKAFEMDGSTPAGSIQNPLQLTAHGHDSKFANRLISGLPENFTGILDEAVQQYEQAININPSYQKAQHREGQSYMQSEEL
jgi:hypothetical protein